MLNHSLPGLIHGREHAIEWIKTIAKLALHHPVVTVCLHADDVADLAPLVEQHGLTWIAGARVDTFSLPRMRAIFDTFEYVITDVEGSHLPYAAWCGCKLAIVPPVHITQWDALKSHPHYQKHPHAQQNFVYFEEASIRSRLPFLFVNDLEKAACPREWAGKLLGVESKRTPVDLARLLGWQWAADDPAFQGLVYEDVATWLGAANPNLDKRWLEQKIR
jgi:hypothetical protein